MGSGRQYKCSKRGVSFNESGHFAINAQTRSRETLRPQAIPRGF